MTQQDQNRDLSLDLYRAVDARDEERMKAGAA
jgi:hypothetical protein